MISNTKNLQACIEARPNNHSGDPRRVGIEIELAGLKAEQLAACVREVVGGDDEWISPFELIVKDTSLGDFKIELDSAQVKQFGDESKIEGNLADAEESIDKTIVGAVESMASTLVPWEIVSPPIPFTEVDQMLKMVDLLRREGAQGTKDTLWYAFGVHLNSELPDLEPSTILNYMRAYVCLFPWIKEIERPDLSRRMTPYINHFEKDYLLHILAADYRPDMDDLIDDYLQHNPTRNRDIDMLPLFSFIDEQRVMDQIEDERINARPTFHYRLPNCDIDNPEWNLDKSIEPWMQVELLAFSAKLPEICQLYADHLEDSGKMFKPNWDVTLQDLLALPNESLS